MCESSVPFMYKNFKMSWYGQIGFLLLLKATQDILMSNFALNRQQFLEPNESIIMISMVKKHQKLTSKKVQLILTNKPKIIYVNPSKLEPKESIVWSDNPNELSVQVASPTNFKICTVSPSYAVFLQTFNLRIEDCPVASFILWL